ncbi:MAG: hypothetical protein FH751_14390 [Firmicutes bacterium]|nr:hypothetical protein [Bacillota bacterium]
MGNRRRLSNEEIDFLKEMVNAKNNPNWISSKYEEKFGKSIAYRTIINKIEEYCNMSWGPKSRAYSAIEKFEDTSSNINGVQTTMFESIPNSDAIPNNTPKDNPDKKHKNNPISEESTVINYLKSIEKEITNMNSRLSKIESYIEKNSPKKKKELVDSFIDIYSSNNNRVSVNINSKLKEKIISHINTGKKKNINQSHAINTALLKALYSDEQ